MAAERAEGTRVLREAQASGPASQKAPWAGQRASRRRVQVQKGMLQNENKQVAEVKRRFQKELPAMLEGHQERQEGHQGRRCS